MSADSNNMTNMEIKPLPIELMQDGDEKGFELVELKGKERLTPHCKNHGAMNKMMTNNIWRCLSEYGRAKPNEEETFGKFLDRVCPACCVESASLTAQEKQQ